MVGLKKIRSFLDSVNTIEGLNSFKLECRDCKKVINIYDALPMSRTTARDPTSLIDSGILMPHEMLEREQKRGNLLNHKRNPEEDHFYCRCEECNNPFMYCYKSWREIHVSNRQCNICRWKKWGGLLLVIAFLGLIAA